MTNISNVRIDLRQEESPENKKEKDLKDALFNLSPSTQGTLAVAIYKLRHKKEPIGKLSPNEIDFLIQSASSDDISTIVLEKHFGISKARFDNILSTCGISEDNKRIFYKSGGSALSDVEKAKLRSALAAEGFTPGEVNSILVGSIGSPQAISNAFNSPLSSLNKTFGSQSIVLKPFPSKPSMTLEGFADIMFEAMQSVIAGRAKMQLYDTENSQKRLEDMILTMNDKIKLTKEQAEKISEQGRNAYETLKNAKTMQALLAFFAALVAIAMAAATIAVSVATFGAGTAPMIAATVGALIGVTGAIVGSGLAISDAIRTDGRSWADSLAGNSKVPKTAEEQEAARIKKEQVMMGMSIAEGIVDVIATVFSFGAYILAALAKTIAAQTIKAILKAIADAMRTMMARTIATLISLITAMTTKIIAGLVQSGALVRSLAGSSAENSALTAINPTMEIKKEELLQSEYFHRLKEEFGEDFAKVKINEYIDQQKKLIVSGDVQALAKLKMELAEKSGSAVATSQIDKFISDAEGEIKQAIVDEQLYYETLSSRVFNDNKALITGLMIGSAVAAMISALATSIVSFKSAGPNQVQSVIQSSSSLDQVDDVIDDILDNADEVTESIEKLAATKDVAAKWRQRSQTALSVTATAQSILGAGSSLYQAISQMSTLEEQKSVTFSMAQIQRMLTMLEMNMVMIKLLTDSSFEVQQITLESMKKTAEAFSDFWKSIETTYAVGVQQQY